MRQTLLALMDELCTRYSTSLFQVRADHDNQAQLRGHYLQVNYRDRIVVVYMRCESPNTLFLHKHGFDQYIVPHLQSKFTLDLRHPNSLNMLDAILKAMHKEHSMPKLTLKLRPQALALATEFTTDVDRIVDVCLRHGFEIDRTTASAAWSQHSEDICAAWLHLPPDDDRLFLLIAAECDVVDT